MKKIEFDEMKKIEIEALKYIDSICRKKNIKYSLIGGSLIGSIRHNGFIPWDDDIDIGMTLDEYLKFEKTVKEDKESNYILLDYESNHQYYYPFNKLVDKRTIMYEDGLKNIENYGIFVDIFIYSGISDNEKKRNKHYKNIKKVQSLLTIYAMKDIRENTFFKTILKKIIKKIIEFIGVGKIIKYSRKLLKKYDANSTQFMISNWPIYGINKELKRTKIFDKFEDHKFEDMQVKIFRDYDEFLRGTYGDYMILPPKEEQKPKHGLATYWR